MGVILEGTAWAPEEIISTGSLLLNNCFKYGGIPKGAIIHYYSPPENEGSFKTTLGLCGLAEMQKLGYKVGGIDTELTPWDQQWLEDKGLIIDDKKLWMSARSLNGEDAINDMQTLVEKKKCKAILFDSVDYARPESYHESDPGSSNTGTHAKLMRQFWQRCKDYSENRGVTIYVVNQARAKVGHMPWDKGETLSGGQASNYAPWVNIRMKRPTDSKLFDEDLIPVKMQIKRSKIGGSWKKFTTYFIQGMGIDRYCELLLLGYEYDIYAPSNKSDFRKGKKTSWHILDKDGSKNEEIGADFVEARNWAFDNEENIIDRFMDHDQLKKIKGLEL